MKFFKRSSQPETKSSQSQEPTNSPKSRCIVCTREINIENATKWKNVWICNNCYYSHGIRIDNNCLRLSDTEFMIQVVYSGLCAIPIAILERIAKSPDFSPIVKRMKYEAINRTLAYLRIYPAFKSKMTKWNYGGNYEIYDDFDSGYTAQLSLEYSDAEFRKILVEILRKHGFGCLVSQYGALGHKNKNYPTDTEASELSKSIQDSVNQSNLEYSEPDWALKDDSN